MNLPIHQRLAIMFATVGFAVFGAVGFATHQLLTRELSRHQAIELETRWELNKMSIVRCCAQPEHWNFVCGKFDFISKDDGRTRYWVISDDPKFNYGTPPAQARLLAAMGDGFGEVGMAGSAHPLKVLVRMVEANAQRPRVHFMVGIDSTPFVETLRVLTIGLTILVIVGALAMSVLGHYIARAGLRPLERVAREAQALSPQRLSQRLHITQLPPELVRLTSSFNGALDRLDAAYQQLGAFNADVAHELRTPLANIMGQTQVALSRERDVSELKDVLHSNLEELDRLRGIVSDMLFLARADRGEMAPDRVEASLAQELARTLEFLELVLEEAGVTVRVRGDARADVQSSLFQRAVVNLLKNAVEHAPRGANIDVALTQEGSQARICVQNPGEEVSASHLGRIFDRFYRIDAARRGSADNHGLGLAIVKAVAIMHGGAVFASSEAGVTSIGFTVDKIGLGQPGADLA